MKPSFDAARADLASALRALEPMSDPIVLCGGFAAWLYQALPNVSPPERALQTLGLFNV